MSGMCKDQQEGQSGQSEVPVGEVKGDEVRKITGTRSHRRLQVGTVMTLTFSVCA